ncbi:hypothetical protein AAF712_003624 [Marasmius tenuissimus]|uniref:RecA family profile 1 domain-containing protein n=1 Tax=Marasmius tenuissimus TaxID=585030 RepID=A0ABR3A6Y6_9AGAR
MSSESRPVHSLALPPSSLLSLRKAGYELLDEIPTQSAQELSQASQSGSVSTQPLMQSAASLASRRRGTTVTKFQTHFPALDKLLDGGISRGNILEISGPPGTPKAKIALGVTRSFLSAKEEVLFVGLYMDHVRTRAVYQFLAL